MSEHMKHVNYHVFSVIVLILIAEQSSYVKDLECDASIFAGSRTNYIQTHNLISDLSSVGTLKPPHKTQDHMYCAESKKNKLKMRIESE